ncbi:MAG: hypothetical protein IKO35_00505, partial [Elusimicrobiaceae bacterium]|nr:hypothetical protein [Elusimicrobiaceae bacterium]
MKKTVLFAVALLLGTLPGFSQGFLKGAEGVAQAGKVTDAVSKAAAGKAVKTTTATAAIRKPVYVQTKIRFPEEQLTLDFGEPVNFSAQKAAKSLSTQSAAGRGTIPPTKDVAIASPASNPNGKFSKDLHKKIEDAASDANRAVARQAAKERLASRWKQKYSMEY